MRFCLRVLPLLALPLLGACDDEVEVEVEDGAVIGVGMFEEAWIDEFVDEVEPTPAGYCDDVTNALWNDAWETLEKQVITQVNQRRAAGAKCGGVNKPPAPALTTHGKLRCAARKHSKDMGSKNFFSHTGSNGSSFSQRITSAGYAWTQAAENIAAGQSTAAAVVTGWMGSTGHCNNIMNPSLKEIGVGYYYAGSSTYKHYWTQDFGKP
jgi:uncharacterized protein YkwD